MDGRLSRVGKGALVRGARNVSRKPITFFYRVTCDLLLYFRPFYYRGLKGSNDGNVGKCPIGIVTLASKRCYSQCLINLYDHRSGGGVEEQLLRYFRGDVGYAY